jgi:biotin-dependent carboxylase-like uncharacterized protein
VVKVLKSGFYSTIQDLGRFGYQEYGVPFSGVMDQYASGIANALLGNENSCAVMEITMTGPLLKFEIDTQICISGANISPKLNENPIPINKAISVKAGDVLSFGSLKFGFRCYLAVSGGFKTEKVLGSQSMYKGVTEQLVISKNSQLLIEEGNMPLNNKNASLKISQSHFDASQIDVLKGPEFDRLSKEQQTLLCSEVFVISKDNNRMAYQLEQNIDNHLEPIITSGVLPGTVQITPSGKLIILMRDCQTTGGYPRVLQLKEASINVIAQKFTGNSINFKLVDY